MGILGVVTLHLTNKEAAADRVEAAKEKREALKHQSDLEGQIKGGQDTAVAAINSVSTQLSDIKTQIKTQGLQSQVADLEKQLAATQKAMLPGPKAKLVFTLVPYDETTSPLVPNLDVHLDRNIDNVVHIEFTWINVTDVTAEDGEVTLAICSGFCKFVKEPEGFFSELSGTPDNQRHHSFQRILARTRIETISADVEVRPPVFDFIVGIQYRCKTCEIEPPQQAFVHLPKPKHLFQPIPRFNTPAPIPPKP